MAEMIGQLCWQDGLDIGIIAPPGPQRFKLALDTAGSSSVQTGIPLGYGCSIRQARRGSPI